MKKTELTLTDKYRFLVKNYGKIPLVDIVNTTGFTKHYIRGVAFRARKFGLNVARCVERGRIKVMFAQFKKEGL
jgi:hypothetical protein